jgi:xyloglucan 6-xylosyltransferase
MKGPTGASSSVAAAGAGANPGFFSGKTLHKTMHNSRITILCGIVTILVLRGTIGSGVDKRNAFRDLVEEEGEEIDVEWDPAVPFRLGAKITDWDEQRRRWIGSHPGANVNRQGKERMLLVTGSQPKQCDNPVGNFQLVKALKNKIDYCRLHDIDIFYNMAHLDIEMAGFWAKLPLLRKLLLAHPEVEWIWWMDSDALFTDMTFEIPIAKYAGYNMVLHGQEDEVFAQKSWLGLNTGSFLFRNCQWSLDLLEVWAQMGPKGPVRVEAGKLLTATLAGRPAFEADDQSALVYFLATDRPRWGSKVFLEHSYCLHGYWVMLVERFEELMQFGAPGGGGSEQYRWPFVTHFVGCKPCGSDRGKDSYATDRCLKHMERAFNFADNQVLELYGLQHATLNTARIHSIRNETSDPLGVFNLVSR